MVRSLSWVILTACLTLGAAWSADPPAKPGDSPDLGESRAVLDELGVAPVPGLPTKLPEAYRPDLLTAAAIKANRETYPLRSAVLDAVEVLQRARQISPSVSIHERDLTDKGKRALVEHQEKAAKAILELEEMATKLERLAAERRKESSKRWQAHYDYVLAQLRLQLAGVHEYNFALGRVRTDDLPKLNKEAGHTGWRLVPSDKLLSRGDVRDIAAQARKALAQISQDHPNTPWAVLAARDAEAKLGLQWESADVPLPKPVKPKKK